MIPRHTKQRILLRALKSVGNTEQLAKMLGVGGVQVDAWTLGFLELPDPQFFKAVEICMDYETPSLLGQMAAEPRTR